MPDEEFEPVPRPQGPHPDSDTVSDADVWEAVSHGGVDDGSGER